MTEARPTLATATYGANEDGYLFVAAISRAGRAVLAEQLEQLSG